MAKRCETFEHTADVGLDASADSLEELFEALAEGLVDVICPREQSEPAQSRRVEARGDDLEVLAVDFLWQVMSAVQFDRQAVASVSVERASQTSLRATLNYEPLDPDKHEIATEVKAVTYHQLKIAKEGEKWVGRVILDL